MRALIRRAITVLILAAIGVGVWQFGNHYLWPPVDRSKIDAIGIIEAPEVNITSRIAGRISWLGLIEGDSVKRGQLVCRIDDVDLRNQLAQARAAREKVHADLDQARRDAIRNRRLFANHIISAQTRDNSETALEEAEANLASAKADVDYFKDQVRDTVIRSPITGTIVNKGLQVGEWVTPGTAILTVDDLSTLWARVDVEEIELPAIYIGKPARITLQSTPPLVFSGRVMAIGQEGQFATERDVRRGRQDIRTFYVKVRVLQAEHRLKPGMTAEVTFQRRGGFFNRNGIRFSRNTSQRAY